MSERYTGLRQEVLNLSDTQIIELTKKLQIAYDLKRTLRYSGARDMSVHGESVAEHIFALLYLAHYFLPLEDPHRKLDREKVRALILFHDFGEIPNGDIPYHQKTPETEAQERADAERVFRSLPAPLNEEGRQLWEEYEAQETPESRFVYALDKIEPIFELLHHPVNEASMKRLKFTYEMHIGKKLRATEEFPVMRKFVDVLSNHMKERGVFWEGS